jgi:signal transduction histidine kinase
VREVVNRTQQAATSYGVALELSPESLSAEVLLRRDLTMRAVANVVRNAIQHAGAGRRVLVRVVVEPGRVTVDVQDTGASVAEDLAVFTPEGQLASKGVPNGRYSRGLGLLCAHIAAGADGWGLGVAEPDEGFGNRFVLVRAL